MPPAHHHPRSDQPAAPTSRHPGHVPPSPGRDERRSWSRSASRNLSQNHLPCKFTTLAARAAQSVQNLTDAAPVVRAPADVGPIFTDPGRELGAVTAATLSYFQDYGRLDVARNYLAGRGITEVADGFCVGYAPIGGGLVSHLKQLGFDEALQVAAGVARAGQDGRLTDVFRDRVVAVIADGSTIAGFVGRAVQADKTPKYLNSPAGELFDKGRLLFGLTEGADRLRRGDLPVLAPNFVSDGSPCFDYRAPSGADDMVHTGCVNNIPWVGVVFFVVGVILRVVFHASSRYWYLKNRYAQPNYWPCAFGGAHVVILLGVALIASHYLSGWWFALVWAAFLLFFVAIAVHVVRVQRNPAAAAASRNS